MYQNEKLQKKQNENDFVFVINNKKVTRQRNLTLRRHLKIDNKKCYHKNRTMIEKIYCLLVPYFFWITMKEKKRKSSTDILRKIRERKSDIQKKKQPKTLGRCLCFLLNFLFDFVHKS